LLTVATFHNSVCRAEWIAAGELKGQAIFDGIAMEVNAKVVKSLY